MSGTNAVAAAAQAGTLPLSGIRLLEFGHTVMGPSCSMAPAEAGPTGAEIEAFVEQRVVIAGPASGRGRA